MSKTRAADGSSEKTAGEEENPPIQNGVQNGTDTEDTTDDGQQAPDELAELRLQVEDLNDQLLRRQADLQNAQRIAQREVQNATRYAAEKLAAALLPGMDGLEQAVQAFEAADGDDNPLAQGVRMTLSTLENALQSAARVMPMEALGEPFDPHLHEAAGMLPAKEEDAHRVLKVLQRGWMMDERVLRPAKVMVAAPKAPKDTETHTNDTGQQESS